MLALQSLADETPLELPALPTPRLAQPATHLMLVGKPHFSERGHLWLRSSHGADFDGIALQRMLTLERLSLG